MFGSADEEDSLVLVYILSGALALTTILVVFLAYTVYTMFRTNSCQGTGRLNCSSLYLECVMNVILMRSNVDISKDLDFNMFVH